METNVEQTTNVESTPVEESEKRSPLYDATRKVMLAAIGAAAIAQEELENFLNRLSERGELAERDARKLGEEMKLRRERMMEENRMRREAARRPASKDEVEQLSARVAELSLQLEELKRTKAPKGGQQ
jgi:polyhydroxyalkanoate synthesis regulator phasin